MSLTDFVPARGLREYELVNPALELATAQPVRIAPGREDLSGCSMALVDNGKWNAAVLLRTVRSLLAERFGTTDGPMAAKQHYNRDLSESEQSRLSGGAQLALAAIGDCGSCTSYTVRDALILEGLGMPTVALVTAPFLPLARGLATTMGTPDIRLVAIPHPLYGISEEEVAQRAAGIVGEVGMALMEQRG